MVGTSSESPSKRKFDKFFENFSVFGGNRPRVHGARSRVHGANKFWIYQHIAGPWKVELTMVSEMISKLNFIPSLISLTMNVDGTIFDEDPPDARSIIDQDLQDQLPLGGFLLGSYN
jgi:hypothetical protein